MSQKIKTIHLLLLEPSSNQAELIINTMRNKGYAVRAVQVLTHEELIQSLEKPGSDLLLAVTDHSDLSAKQAIEQIAESGRDIPCIVLLNNYSEDQAIEAMNYGAMDAVSRENLPLISLKSERELSALEIRRKKNQAEIALKAEEKRCTLLLDNSQDAIAYVHDGMHVYANKAYLELFGYTDHDELMCIPVLDMIQNDHQAEFRQYLKEIPTGSEQQNFNFVGVTSDLSEFEAIMTLSSANYDDEACTQILIRPATDNAELEEKLKELSAQDNLTELYNKKYFTEQLQNTIDSIADNGKSYSVLYIQYDQYNEILKTYGMMGVDFITQEYASWLSQNCKDSDLPTRLGDHAFALLFEDSSAQKAREKATHLCEKAAQHLFDIEGRTVKLTTSIGIFPIGDSSSSAIQVLSDAQATCNRVEGGNGFKVFNKAILKSSSEDEIEVLDNIQEAIEAGRIQLMFQPIVKLHGEEKALYQVLLRMVDAEGNPLDSGKIFPIAKAAGLGKKLDRWVVTNALKSLKNSKTAKDTQLFVSLSGPSLIDPSLPGFVEKIVEAGGLQRNNLVFQIDETDAANHLKRVIALCAQLKNDGFSVCLSGFGENPDQKTLLDQLDVDYIKIADSKSQELLQSDDVATEIQSLLDEIHARDKLSIIPRVEEASMLAALWPMNVKYIQGFYLQKPGDKMDYDFASGGF